MLKIKSFVLALCVSPLSLVAFQMPSIAGTGAGVASGVPTPTVQVNINPGGGILGNSQGTVATPVQTNAVNVVVNNAGPNSITVTLVTTATPISAPNGQALGVSNAATVAALASTIPTTTLVGSATVTTTPATATSGTTITVSRANGTSVTLVAPTTTSAGSVRVGNVTVAIPATATPALATAATQAAVAVLLAGGSPSQAAVAAAIAGAGANVNAAVTLVAQLSKMFTAPAVVGAVQQESNLNASLLKSFDGVKELLLAQSKGRTINPAELAEAINAYNAVLDTSSPAVVAELSKNKAFMEIGQTLRALRSAIAN